MAGEHGPEQEEVSVSLQEVLRQSDHDFGLSVCFKDLMSTRPLAVIPTPLIAKAIVAGAILGVKSARHLDGVGRMPEFRRLLGSFRDLVASDTTMARTLLELPISKSQALMKFISRRLKAQSELGIVLDNRQWRVATLDGSVVGKQYFSILREMGRVPAYWDLEPYGNRGLEREASYTILKRLRREPGLETLNLVCCDALYAGASFWSACRAGGVKGIVKCEDQGFDILKDANGLFDDPCDKAVERVSGVDTERGCDYEVLAAADLEWSDDITKLKVARVREVYFKGKFRGQTHEFYVLSQEQSLSGQSLRELAHLRWDIENGFKALNEQVYSKHMYSRNKHTATNWAILQMIGMMLISAYRHHLGKLRDRMRGYWDHGSLSLRCLRTLIVSSLSQIREDSS